MPNIRELHNNAMDIAERAFAEKARGGDASELFRHALELERAAAIQVPIEQSNEPSRSILFRSAASLALNAGELQESERLVAQGLSGFPPPEIQTELRDLYENVSFQHHLNLRGLELADDSFVVSIWGNASWAGGAEADQVLHRLDKVQKLIYRTIERLKRVPYRLKGTVDAKIKQAFPVYVATPQVASLAVKILVGQRSPQLEMFSDPDREEVPSAPEVVQEVMACLRTIEGGDAPLLREMIPDETYRTNFVALAKEIAPDGNEVKSVGFVFNTAGSEQKLTLRKGRKEIEVAHGSTEPRQSNGGKSAPKSLVGLLLTADSPIPNTEEYGKVRLVMGGKRPGQLIHVPVALMADVVQTYFESNVKTDVVRRKGRLFLESIEPAPEDNTSNEQTPPDNNDLFSVSSG